MTSIRKFTQFGHFKRRAMELTQHLKASTQLITVDKAIKFVKNFRQKVFFGVVSYCRPNVRRFYVVCTLSRSLQIYEDPEEIPWCMARMVQKIFYGVLTAQWSQVVFEEVPQWWV